MTSKSTAFLRAVPRVALGLVATALLLGVTVAFADNAEQTLLVWASDQAHVAPTSSPSSTSIAIHRPTARSFAPSRCPETARSATSRTTSGLSRDGRTMALGGLLSVLRGQDQVFFFDVSDPRDPTFIRSDNPPESSITDEFAPLENGGFLVTFMGGANGAQPGRVVEYDADTAFVQTWPHDPSAGRIQSARHLD